MPEPPPSWIYCSLSVAVLFQVFKRLSARGLGCARVEQSLPLSAPKQLTTTYIMVATKVLISLCIAGLSAAASYRPRTGRQGNGEAAIVGQVVNTLQPAIADAVANALASLQAQQFSSDRAQFEAEFASQNAGQANAVNNNAQYSYQYQVRDDEEGTYIFKNEDRLGLDVTGVYGYVDPEGTLITVNYQAGPDGFTQELERQVDYLSSGGASGDSFGGRSPAPAPVPVAAPRQPALDEAALIAQIVSALQPQITSSVNSAISSQQQQVVRNVPRISGGANNGDRLVPLFGFNRA